MPCIKWYMFDLKSYLMLFLWLHFLSYFFISASFFCLVAACAEFFFSSSTKTRTHCLRIHDPREEKKNCIARKRNVELKNALKKEFAFKVVCLFSFHLFGRQKHIFFLFGRENWKKKPKLVSEKDGNLINVHRFNRSWNHDLTFFYHCF